MRAVSSSRYEARGKFGEHERCVRVARGVADSNSSFLSALQTSQVFHISMNAQLTHESFVLEHFQRDFLNVNLFGDVISVRANLI